MWDKATSGVTWYNVVGDSPASLLLEATLSTTVIPGNSYQFKVRASNIHGWGDFSSVTTIKAAQIPS